ncbi:MAG: dihydrolipoamide acetyltransferase family protein [Gemmatimonadales bacterium]
MPREIRMPELAESVVEGEIQRWLVAEGEAVAKDQPIVEVMTDKATVELPSPYAGTLVKLLAAEGEVVAVHAPIALIESEDQGADAPAGPTPPAAKDASLFTASEHREAVRNPFLAARAPALPGARRLARQLGVDLGSVAGSGPGGRIRPDDVSAAASAARGPLAPRGYVSPPGEQDRETRVPLRGVRRTIVDQMTESHLHTVRTLAVDEADWTALIQTREGLDPEARARGVKLTYLPFIFLAVARALQQHPAVNASLDEVSREIVLKRYVHLGMAVETETGLMVPVVRDVPAKTVLDLAAETQSLAESARDGSVAPERMQGSCFTVTSIGKVGTLFSFPIIKLPDAGILGVHTIQRRPVVRTIEGEERVVPRDMVYLSLSFDHRLIDGFTAATFLRDVIALLEAPEQLLHSA